MPTQHWLDEHEKPWERHKHRDLSLTQHRRSRGAKPQGARTTGDQGAGQPESFISNSLVTYSNYAGTWKILESGGTWGSESNLAFAVSQER